MGRGLGRGGSELEPFVAALRSGTDGWGGERGRGGEEEGVRGPEDEERGISTPRVSQEKPPSLSLPRKRGGQAPALFPEGLGLWPVADPFRGGAPWGAPPTPSAPGAGQAGGVRAAGSGPSRQG